MSGASGATVRHVAAPRPLVWRLVRDDPSPGSRNMALDHALAAHLGEGRGVLRLYGWSRRTVSIGRNEPALGVYRAPADRSLDFVRRPTGGRAVMHWRELTYAVIAPLDAWGGLRAAYRAIHQALAEALGAAGAPVSVASPGTGRPLAPDAGPCFQSPAAGEVIAGERKLVGSAQARLEGALLQHGSILLEDDQSRLETLGRGAGARAATLRELRSDVTVDEWADLVAMSLRETFGGTWARGAYSAAELETAERLEVERYARGSWTWRR